MSSLSVQDIFGCEVHGPSRNHRTEINLDGERVTKRAFDILMSSIGLVVLSPVIVILSLIILVTMGWPVFYAPSRIGCHERPFTLIKFRTMRDASSGQITHHSGNDDPRITGIGRFMRRSKLDELPQLLNVLLGTMSLVGPRPETIDYLQHYTEDERIIFSVRPGITDYASIEFADLGTILAGDDPDKAYFEKVWTPKMALRIKYVRERSFVGDIKLILLTLKSAAGWKSTHR